MSTQAEPLLFQITHQTIQEGDTTQEAYQVKKNPPLCRLSVWEVQQEAMGDQRQILRRVDQETLVDQNRGHDLD